MIYAQFNAFDPSEQRQPALESVQMHGRDFQASVAQLVHKPKGDRVRRVGPHGSTGIDTRIEPWGRKCIVSGRPVRRKWCLLAERVGQDEGKSPSHRQLWGVFTDGLCELRNSIYLHKNKKTSLLHTAPAAQLIYSSQYSASCNKKPLHLSIHKSLRAIAKKQHNDRNPTRMLKVNKRLGAGCEEIEINKGKYEG